jgi:hypothetical protein
VCALNASREVISHDESQFHQTQKAANHDRLIVSQCNNNNTTTTSTESALLLRAFLIYYMGTARPVFVEYIHIENNKTRRRERYLFTLRETPTKETRII